MHKTGRVLVTIGFVAAATFALACVTAPRVQPIQSDHAAAVHAVHNEHVSSLMKSISHSHSRVRSFRQPLVRERAQDYKALAGHAAEIVGYAEELRAFADEGLVSGKDRVMFLAFVDTLQERAKALRTAASESSKTGTMKAFARLTSTCNSCHYAFREQIQQHRAGE